MMTSGPRVASIDLVRGAVMILMAIDHVRVYAAVPPGGPTPGVFFTRWITHFCAPAFLFLAGTSAFLHGRRHEGLPRFLLTRGLWLVFLDLTVLRVAWTFNLDFAHYNMAGVIWVIGWSMILLAALVRLPAAIVGGIGVVIMATHNLLPSPGENVSWWWNVLYVGFSSGPFTIGENGPPVVVLYSLIPWVGVMAAGYGFGRIVTSEPARRDRLCYALGLGATALFVLLRGLNGYGEPRPWSGDEMPALLSFLNTSKYPASFQFLLMTLGPTITLLPVLERAGGPLARWIEVFGRVPFFFYMLHIPLIHALALIVSQIRLGTISPWLFANHPMGPPPAPDGYAWSLALLYLVWLVAIVLLYFPSRWFTALKAKRKDWWLSYL
jgi:uncharacterized membrane protein